MKASVRMSFVFPPEFREILSELKKKHGKDMTYIIMEAVNEWVIKNENILPEDIEFADDFNLVPEYRISSMVKKL